MNKTELIELLEELAEKDLVELQDIDDHPCSVAIRAIEQCFEDIKTLQWKSDSKLLVTQCSKNVQTLCRSPYNPNW